MHDQIKLSKGFFEDLVAGVWTSTTASMEIERRTLYPGKAIHNSGVLMTWRAGTIASLERAKADERAYGQSGADT